MHTSIGARINLTTGESSYATNILKTTTPTTKTSFHKRDAKTWFSIACYSASEKS